MRGFSVVADEVRKLGVNTEINARNISDNLNVVIKGIQEAQVISNEVSVSYNDILEDVDVFADSVSEITQGLEELSPSSKPLQMKLKVHQKISQKTQAALLNHLPELTGFPMRL